jgi:eukaryotic-like serine/threonine-protein kinase
MRFLIIDDDPDFRRILRYHLEVEWPDAPVGEHQPSSTRCGPSSVPLGGADVVMLGYPIGSEVDLHWLRQLRRRGDCPPVLLFAEPSDEMLAVDALKAGAASYFPKAKIRHRRLVETIRAETGAAVGSQDPAASSGGDFIGERGFGGGRRHRFLAKLHGSDLSSVYLAEDGDGGGRVVFKVVQHVPDTGGGRLFDRFLQEYEIVAKVRHPNVVRIHDLGIADDHAYIVMEYFEAGSLAARIVQPLGPERAVDYLRQIGRALGAIHDAGILHRDLKPANVMFRPDDTLALIDFGLAKQLRLHAAITGTGQIFGTPYYMSPEQGHAERTDARSDLYSLGCILYEMLTAEKPFVASSAMGVIYKHANAPRPRLPADLKRLQEPLDRLLAIDPADRFQSAAELLDAVT